MKIKKNWGDPIDIEWKDAIELLGWKSHEEAISIDKEVSCFTRGWFVGQTDEYVIVCHTKGYSKEDDITGVIKIPKKWVKVII